MESLRAPEKRLRDLAGDHPHGLLVIGRDGHIVFADESAETFFRRKPGALAGQSLITLLAAGEGADIRLNASSGMRISEIEWEGRPAYLARLRGSQAPVDDLRNREIVTALPDLIFINRGGRITFVNEAGVRLLRAASADQIIGRSPLDFFHPDYHAVIRARIVELLQRPASVPAMEEKMIALDGTVIDVEVRALSFLSGGESNIQVICRDITEQKSTARALRTSLDRFRQLAESMPQIVWTADPGTGLDYASPAFAEYTGMSNESPGLAWFNAVHPDDIAAVMAAREEGERTEQPFTMEFRVRRASDGAYRWHFSNAVPIRDENGVLVKWFGAATDIHDRKSAQEEAGRLATRLAATLENITDAFYLLDSDWRFTYLNGETERLLRRSRSELLGKSIWEEFPATIGTLIESELKSATAQGRPVAFQEFAPRLKIWVDVRAYPSPEGLAVYFRDVTQQRELEARLRQAQRLEAVGQLTGGIAHDFNNLLTVIIGNAEMLAQRSPPKSGLQDLAELTLAAAERGAELTHRLLAFSRRQALEPKAVDVNALLSNMHALLTRALGEGIEIKSTTTRDLWPAFVDAAQVEAAILNLCINARDAMPKGGRLTIETGNTTLDESYAGSHEEVTAGEYVMLAVSDTGTGMTTDVMARAFEPFFTTKEQRKGTGLGLSMVHGFIKQSGGHVKIYSEIGHGTTVKLYLPRAIDGAPAATRSHETAVVGGTENVLLVEDDDKVREFATARLRELGYRVTAARDGVEALAVLNATPDFDLLFTDVVMPGGVKGPELATQARKINPSIRVLFTSGYTENAIVHHGRLDPGVHLLNKPYRRRELAAKVRLVLDEKRTAL